jgi:hydrogenase maturation protease
MTEPPTAIRVLGMGNVLMGDDAFGPYVARMFASRFDVPDRVSVEDVGTPGLDLTPYLHEARAIIVIDTVLSDGPAGTIRRYDRDQLLEAPPPDRSSPHQPGLREALMAAELTTGMPEEVIVIGVVPEDTEAGTGLSAALGARVNEVIALLVDELTRLGSPPRPAAAERSPDIWWE